MDRRIRSGYVSALVRRKKYDETFLYMCASLTVDLAIMNEGKFLPYYSAVAKKLFELNSLRLGYGARWSCKKKEFGRLSVRCSAFGCEAGSCS